MMICLNPRAPIQPPIQYPQALQEPVYLADWTPPMARRFTWRQLQLIQQGYSKAKSRAILENELEEYNAQKYVCYIDDVKHCGTIIF